MSFVDANTNVLSGLISSTPINPITTGSDEIIAQALPSPLHAPAGWRSVVIHSNSPLPINGGLNLVNTSNSYEEYNTSNSFGGGGGGYNTSNSFGGGFNTANVSSTYNEFNTSGSNQSAIDYLNNTNTGHLNSSFNTNVSTNYINKDIDYLNSTYHTDLSSQNRKVYTAQEQRNIINRIETQHPPPLLVRKTLPNNSVTYKQNVSVKYLRPPTPPPPGPLIIREVRPPPPRPQSPIQIRQRPPPPPTPPPVVLRERPPQPPPQIPAKVVEKVLPPPPQAARRVVVERYGAPPPKPADVIIERWLPYKQTGQRRVLVERAPPAPASVQEPNLLVLHDAPNACVKKQFINQGVIRADPDEYIRRYGSQLNSWQSGTREGYIVDEASRAIPPPITSSIDHYDDYKYQRATSPYIPQVVETRRVVSPVTRVISPVTEVIAPVTRVVSPIPRVVSVIPRSSSYHYGYKRYATPYCDDEPYYDLSDRYYNKYRYRHRYDPYCYDDDYFTMKDITPSWNSYCGSSVYDPYYHRSSSYCEPYYRRSSYYEPYDRYSSYCPSNTIRVRSEGELRDVLCDLTNGHVPAALDTY